MTEIVQSPHKSVWDQAEELVGYSPPPDALRNAIHAIITASSWTRIEFNFVSSKEFNTMLESPITLRNVEYLARGYEAICLHGRDINLFA